MIKLSLIFDCVNQPNKLSKGSIPLMSSHLFCHMSLSKCLCSNIRVWVPDLRSCAGSKDAACQSFTLQAVKAMYCCLQAQQSYPEASNIPFGTILVRLKIQQSNTSLLLYWLSKILLESTLTLTWWNLRLPHSLISLQPSYFLHLEFHLSYRCKV